MCKIALLHGWRPMTAMSEVDEWKHLFDRLFTTPPQAMPWTRRLLEDPTQMTADEQHTTSVSEERMLGMLHEYVAERRIAAGVHQRLHASRLCADFATAERAAAAIGVQGRNYRAVENGTRKPTPRLMDGASAAFDVSLEYLLLAVPQRPNDLQAAETERLIRELKARTWSDDRTIGERLKTARRDAGFRSADEALARFGWKPSAYKGHEAGFKPIPLDRLISYARRLGVDARTLAFGWAGAADEPNAASAAPSSFGAGAVSKAGSSRSGSAAESRGWPWLTLPILSADVLTVQVLRMSDDGMFVPARFPLTVPGIGTAVPKGHEAIFAVLATDRKEGAGVAFLILRPYLGEDDAQDLVVSDGTRVLSGVAASAGLTEADPLTVRGSSDHPIVLGRWIGEFVLRWENSA